MAEGKGVTNSSESETRLNLILAKQKIAYYSFPTHRPGGKGGKIVALLNPFNQNRLFIVIIGPASSMP